MRAFFLFAFMALVSAGPAKGKSGKATSPTLSPTVTFTSAPTAGSAPSVASVGANAPTVGKALAAGGKASAPTPATVLLDLKVVASTLFQLFEAQKYQQAAQLFAPGMSYITNGQAYDLDLSIPADIKSIPQRNRTNVVWTYTDGDVYEIWGHCLVNYPNQPQPDPEFVLIHFNRMGLIDVFSHIQPKAAQCTAMVKDVVKLRLMRPDGTIVDAPQDQLQVMLANQEAAKAMANGTWANGTGVYANGVWTNTTNGTRVVTNQIVTTITTNTTNSTRMANGTSMSTNTTNTTTIRSTTNATRS